MVFFLKLGLLCHGINVYFSLDPHCQTPHQVRCDNGIEQLLLPRQSLGSTLGFLANMTA